MRRILGRTTSNAGLGATLLLSPHVVLGAWLRTVPDHDAFRTAQLATLAHVSLALLSLPIAAIWIIRHVRVRTAGTGTTSRVARGIQWALALACGVAILTGLAVTWGGNIIAVAPLHAICGVLVGTPFAVHLWLSSRRIFAAAMALVLAASTIGAQVGFQHLPPAPIEAVVPPFRFETRPMQSYEPSAWCGECHVTEFAEWRKSMHSAGIGAFKDPDNFRKGGGNADTFAYDLASIGKPDHVFKWAKSMDAQVTCTFACHMPVSFYGDDPHRSLDTKSVSSEGVGCAFCHTLRGVRADTPLQPLRVTPAQLATALRAGDIKDIGAEILQRMAFFVSAPETVRTYLGQRSQSRFAREVASLLIRWRPDVHRHDYHSAFLDSSRACLACHSLGFDSRSAPHLTYSSWEQSAYNTGDPRTEVTCQDCHMARHVADRKAQEEMRFVLWGPSHPGARSHFFPGGNVRTAQATNEEDLARIEHEMNTLALSLHVLSARREGAALSMEVAVKSETVGHLFPTMETHLRYAWIEVKALDVKGLVIAETGAPGPPDNDVPALSPIIYRSVQQLDSAHDTLIAAGATRTFATRLPLAPEAQVSRVILELHQSLDPQPMAVASWTPPP